MTDMADIYVEEMDTDVQVEYSLYDHGRYEDFHDEIIIYADPVFKILRVFDEDGNEISQTGAMMRVINTKLSEMYWENEEYLE